MQVGMIQSVMQKRGRSTSQRLRNDLLLLLLFVPRLQPIVCILHVRWHIAIVAAAIVLKIVDFIDVVVIVHIIVIANWRWYVQLLLLLLMRPMRMRRMLMLVMVMMMLWLIIIYMESGMLHEIVL